MIDSQQFFIEFIAKELTGDGSHLSMKKSNSYNHAEALYNAPEPEHVMALLKNFFCNF